MEVGILRSRFAGTGALIIALVMCAGAVGVNGAPPQVVSAPNFVVTGDGETWAFSELSSVNLDVEPQEFIYADEDSSVVHTKQYGKSIPPTVTLKKPLDADTTLWGWHLSVQTGEQNTKHDVLLTAYSAGSAGGSEAFQWELVNAWPSKISLTGAEAGAAEITVTFQAEAIIPAPSGEPVIPVSEAGGIDSGTAAVAPSASPTKPNGSPGVLNGVSCASATACTAVGRELTGGKNLPLVEQWNGSYWASQVAPMPAGASAAILNAVSCPAPTNCTAVGESHTVTGVHTLAESWNGSAWTVGNTADVTGAASTLLDSVACSAASLCLAVGTTAGGASHFAVSELWNGTDWQLKPVPKPTAQRSFATTLTSVSCSSSSNCSAVGGNGASPLAAKWDGTTWKLQSPAVPSGASSTTLSSVACTADGACLAVGSSTSPAGTTALAESSRSSDWTISTVPTPTGTRAPTLRSVACFAANSCAAVGSIINPSYGLKMLVESWNGNTWTKVPSPDPAGETGTAFTGVSCAAQCAAVGAAAKPSMTALMQMLFTS